MVLNCRAIKCVTTDRISSVKGTSTEYWDYKLYVCMNLSWFKSYYSPFAAMAPSKKPLDTVSRGQLVSRGLMGGGGCSSCALGSTSGT